MIKNKVMIYFSNLSTRERCFLCAGGAIVLVLLFYALCWHPLTSRIANLQQSLQRSASRLSWLNNAANRLNRLPKSAARQAVADIMTLTEHSLSQAGLAQYLREVSQPKSGELRLVFVDLPFDTFIDWLQNFAQRYSIKPLKFKVKYTGGAGMVSATITLKSV